MVKSILFPAQTLYALKVGLRFVNDAGLTTALSGHWTALLVSLKARAIREWVAVNGRLLTEVYSSGSIHL